MLKIGKIGKIKTKTAFRSTLIKKKPLKNFTKKRFNNKINSSSSSSSSLKLNVNKFMPKRLQKMNFSTESVNIEEKTIASIGTFLENFSIEQGEDYKRPNVDITKSTKLEELGLCSLDAVELCLHIEDEFNLQLTDETLGSVGSVEDIIKYVKESQAEQKL